MTTNSGARTRRHRKLSERHSWELKQSGISIRTAIAAGLCTENRQDQIAAMLGWDSAGIRNFGDCLVFRYRELDGALNGYCRLKPDNPRKSQGRVVKYEAPKGKPQRAYFPPGTIASLQDVRKPLVITEGEKKALCADQNGFPSIGIAGVYSWCKRRERDEKGKTHGQKEMIDDLAVIPWKGRNVYIAFDSDLTEKPEVAKAEHELAEALQRFGAVVRCLRIPPGRANQKQGLDDFLVSRSEAELNDLIHDAVEPVNSGLSTGLTCLADVQPQQVEWLWPQRIPAGKLTLVVGDPEAGKSLMTLDIAARVSRGTEWPDGSECKPGNVVLLSVEDELEDTIRPRLDAARADVSRIVHLDLNCLKADLYQLEAALRQLQDARLVIIDPISAYLPGVDSHKNAEVRSVLKPLAALAAKWGVAVIGVTHLTKQEGGSAMYRAMGSLAFVAAARTAWMVMKNPKDAGQRLFLRIKNNLSAVAKGLSFRIIGPPGSIEWDTAEVEASADDLLSACRNGQGPGRREAATEWLESALASGMVEVQTLQQKARALGIAWRTVERAASELHVGRFRGSFGGKCFWRLPNRNSSFSPKVLAQTGENGTMPQES